MKKRTNFNWKFKEKESPEFLAWFENQENIANSLRNAIYHIVEQYGTGDFSDRAIQRQVIKDTIVLEFFKGKDVSRMLVDTINNSTEQPKASVVMKETETQAIEKIEEVVVKENKKANSDSDNSYIEGIDPNTI